MDADTLENIYYAVTALVMAWLIFNGWRQGVVRQFMAMFAIASAYAAAYFGARESHYLRLNAGTIDRTDTKA